MATSSSDVTDITRHHQLNDVSSLSLTSSSSSPEQYCNEVTSATGGNHDNTDTSSAYWTQDSDVSDLATLQGEADILSDASGGSDPQSKVVHSTGADLADKRFKGKPLKDKTCSVCGDKALGYNFNAISCESCKAFFRRNAGKEIRGRCDGTCDITVESRSYCKKCRLRKCFEVGMKKDLILNDQQKQIRRIKIQENRFRRKGMPIPAELQAQAVALTTPAPKQACTAEKKATKSTVAPELPLAEKLKLDPETLTHTFTREVELEEIKGLKDDACEKIREIIKAFQVSFDGPMERNPLATPTTTDFLNMADTSVRRLVKMAKNLSQFHRFSQDDQISLLKGSIVEVLVLRSAKMFDTATKGWLVNKSGQQHMVSAHAMFNNQESITFFQQYQRFATMLLQSTRHDNIVLMIMIVMTVLSPDRSSVSSTNEIAKVQESYAGLLQHYVEVRYPEDELMFARVLQKLADVRNLNETHTKMLMHMDVQRLEPLIVEIFDISS